MRTPARSKKMGSMRVCDALEQASIRWTPARENDPHRA